MRLLPPVFPDRWVSSSTLLSASVNQDGTDQLAASRESPLTKSALAVLFELFCSCKQIRRDVCPRWRGEPPRSGQTGEGSSKSPEFECLRSSSWITLLLLFSSGPRARFHQGDGESGSAWGNGKNSTVSVSVSNIKLPSSPFMIPDWRY